MNQFLMSQREMFDLIMMTFESMMINNFESMKTKNGKTQASESIYKKIMRKCLEELNIFFEEAGSQQPHDFRIPVNESMLNLEMKKTNSVVVMLNDTLPSSKGYYIIIFTKREKIIGYRGDELLNIGCTNEELEILYQKQKEFLEFKDQAKKKNTGFLNSYPRQNYSINFKDLLNE